MPNDSISRSRVHSCTPFFRKNGESSAWHPLSTSFHHHSSASFGKATFILAPVLMCVYHRYGTAFPVFVQIRRLLRTKRVQIRHARPIYKSKVYAQLRLEKEQCTVVNVCTIFWKGDQQSVWIGRAYKVFFFSKRAVLEFIDSQLFWNLNESLETTQCDLVRLFKYRKMELGWENTSSIYSGGSQVLA